MMTERQGYQIKMHSLTIEDLVPGNHLLRKVERIVKWDFIYEAVLYSETVGRPSIDPSHGIIIDAAVTPGSANDSTPYWERIEYIRSHFGLPVQTAARTARMGPL